jgi:hypothetical protein
VHRTLLAVCTAVVMSAAIVGAQSKVSHSDDKSSDAAKAAPTADAVPVTFTGCLSPADKSQTFYLMSAKQKGVKGQATTVKLVPASKKVGLDPFVTQEVEVTGTLDRTSVPAGDSDKTPTLTVTKVKSRASGC